MKNCIGCVAVRREGRRGEKKQWVPPPIFSLPRARLECSEIIFRFMRSVGVCVLLIIMDAPGEKRLASVKRYEGDPPEGALLRLGCGMVLAARSGGPFEPIFAIGAADRGNSCHRAGILPRS